jgi:2-polyprenyl-3-methyl-5-hydroxy-6-metoxy-1,4-benzoquinol methylase
MRMSTGASMEPCPACGADGAETIWSRPFRNRFWELARCRACRLHFTTPTPSEEELRAFYAGNYHASLREGEGTDRAFGRKYERYADRVASFMRPGGRVVDVGCSTGLLVRMLCDRGFDAEGIELNEESAAWGRERYGARIHTLPIERCGIAEGSLDGIILTDVLEHMRHPGVALRGIVRHLAIGGRALVTFPDIESIESRYRRALARILRRPWMWSCCRAPLHVWEFTPESARACFAGAGCEIRQFVRTHVPIEQHRAWALRAIEAPVALIGVGPIARLCGSQMEFVIERTRAVDDASLPSVESARRAA